MALDEWGYPLFDQGPLRRTTLKRARRAVAESQPWPSNSRDSGRSSGSGC
ncbi:hypothetical protein [Streptomyces sp. NPDC001530]